MSAHQELADFIKSVHIDLRLRSRDIGPSAAWQEHCADKDKLEKYARAMHELASVHWEKNNGTSCELSRIFWVMKKIEWYFHNDGRKVFLEKELKLSQKYGIESEINEAFPPETVSLLDVGSCYNPFSKFPSLDVTAIDLAPANENVLMCDFLTVPIGDSLIVNPKNQCTQLPEESYDVVLFSLLLEYMPSPKQRYTCCSKAALLLRKGGILLILTPDSKHATANSKLLKNWRLALASLGFILILTEKLKHLRCLFFSKSNNSDITDKWLSLQNVTHSLEESIIIPQDSNSYEHFIKENESLVKENGALERSEYDNKCVAESFSHLLFENDIF